VWGDSLVWGDTLVWGDSLQKAQQMNADAMTDEQ
jgi:hypothetical protein